MRLAWPLLALLCLAAAAPPSGKPPALPPPDTLYASLVDGTLAALDASTGALRWTFATGSPLLGSSASPSQPGSAVVFPSSDGALYTYRAAAGAVERLPVNARELVAASPAPTHDGGVVLGSRRSAAHALDAATGRLLRSFSAEGGDEEAEKLASGWGGGRALLVGRSDWSVHSLDVLTGQERWNVSYSELTLLNAPGRGGEETTALVDEGAVPPPLSLVLETESLLRSLQPDGACSIRARSNLALTHTPRRLGALVCALRLPRRLSLPSGERRPHLRAAAALSSARPLRRSNAFDRRERVRSFRSAAGESCPRRPPRPRPPLPALRHRHRPRTFE